MSIPMAQKPLREMRKLKALTMISHFNILKIRMRPEKRWWICPSTRSVGNPIP